MATATEEETRKDVESADDAETIAAVNAAGDGPVDDLDKSIEDMADEVPEPKPTPPMQIPIEGMNEGIGASFGGARPTVSEIRLLGGKMPLEGSFQKGDEFELIVRVKVNGVLGQDVLDDWGKVTRTVRRHMARMISVRRHDAP